MNVQIEPHTIARAEERGAKRNEILDVLENGIIIPAKNNRLCRYKVFPFNDVRNGKLYSEKRVEVIYLIENNNVITITVYVFFGKWEDKI